jgi:nicotinate-nucleotide pyrophosphorylase (carboxylating)
MFTISQQEYEELIDSALLEDIGSGDITAEALICEDSRNTAIIKSKQEGVVCGASIAKQVFLRVDPTLVVKVYVQDGDRVIRGTKVITVEGNTRSILMAERTALNFMAHLSGIATETSIYVQNIQYTGAAICDTRKTMPGWRKLEKYAVYKGGGVNHRFGLWDAILIKENHIAAAGSISKALQRAEKMRSRAAFIQIEVETLLQLEEALAGNPDMILLDNMSIADLSKAVEICKKSNYNGLIEASGNITVANVRNIAQTGVDRISVGAITHSAKVFDFSLLLE